jgi:hypothetical protein
LRLAHSFDHLVGGRYEIDGQVKSESTAGSKVDNEVKPR